MRRRGLVAVAIAAALPGCALFRRRKPAAPPALLRYAIGPPYQAGGVWRYPRESFDAVETGLATVIGAHEAFATDGVRYDPTALVAAHPTLQLPCVARVTNLETGLSLLVRLDDRGPASPARALALSTRAARLLGAASAASVLRVRIEVQEAASRALADALAADRDRIAVTAAPTASVLEEALPPPGSAARAAAERTVPAPSPAAAAAPAPTVLPRLPEQLARYPVRATELFVDLGAFSGPTYARRLAARLADLGARLDTDYAAPRDRAWRVRIGPLASVAEADAMLDRTLAAGVVDARIVVDEG